MEESIYRTKEPSEKPVLSSWRGPGFFLFLLLFFLDMEVRERGDMIWETSEEIGAAKVDAPCDFIKIFFYFFIFR
jgi:hypothetical protein